MKLLSGMTLVTDSNREAYEVLSTREKCPRLARQESASRPNFEPQFLPEGLAPLESFEKLF